MPEIVPRWEWRWFGRRFGPAEAHLAARTPDPVQESDETYLLSGAGDNVKVRDGLMDIKVLRETQHDGLEQWTLVMTAGFPLPADQAELAHRCTVRVHRRDCGSSNSIGASSSSCGCSPMVPATWKSR